MLPTTENKFCAFQWYVCCITIDLFPHGLDNKISLGLKIPQCKPGLPSLFYPFSLPFYFSRRYSFLFFTVLSTLLYLTLPTRLPLHNYMPAQSCTSSPTLHNSKQRTSNMSFNHTGQTHSLLSKHCNTDFSLSLYTSPPTNELNSKA